jgi:hypothetical protein
MTSLIGLGNGLGGFSPPQSTPLATTLIQVAVGDFNGDGKQGPGGREQQRGRRPAAPP